MPAYVLNHVSISVHDLEVCARFYEDLFGMERIPTPNFGGKVQWLRLGTQQLHLAERDQQPGRFNHFGITVDDFPRVYYQAKELGVIDDRMQGYYLCELPDGNVQLYLHDPAGNVLEVNHPDAGTLPEDIATDLTRLADRFPQDDENLAARLYATAQDAPR